MSSYSLLYRDESIINRPFGYARVRSSSASTASRSPRILELLLYLLAKRGPSQADFDILKQELDEEHRRQFTIRDGLSVRRTDGLELDRFLSSHPRVFRTTATMQGFAWRKPHGYAGDFEMIERIYNVCTSGQDELKRWDEMFHASAAARAVRQRGEVLSSIMQETQPRTILTIGCGPAHDIINALQSLPYRAKVTFVDLDSSALARAAVNVAAEEKVEATFVHKNALRYSTDEKFDLIWSSGLFDYLNDKVAAFLLKRLREMLSARGSICFGNFSHDNPSRSYMELIGDWMLRHRSLDDLRRLSGEANISKSRFETRVDATGLNLFAHCG